MQHRDVYRRLGLLGAALVALIVAGSGAYSLAEGVSVWNAFVWALDTIATFQEKLLKESGKIQ